MPEQKNVQAFEEAFNKPDQPKPQPAVPSPEVLSAKLLGALGAKLTIYENVETAIAVYRQCNVTIRELEDVKRICLDMARQMLYDQGMVQLHTPFGSAGWTKPKKAKLDTEMWQNAVRQNADLARFQAEFDRAKRALEAAQEVFMQLPEPTFFIK